MDIDENENVDDNNTENNAEFVELRSEAVDTQSGVNITGGIELNKHATTTHLPISNNFDANIDEYLNTTSFPLNVSLATATSIQNHFDDLVGIDNFIGKLIFFLNLFTKMYN